MPHALTPRGFLGPTPNLGWHGSIKILFSAVHIVKDVRSVGKLINLIERDQARTVNNRQAHSFEE